MAVTTHPDRISPRCKQPPLSDAEMVARWRAGDALAQIANAAKRRNGLTRVEVRAIVLGPDEAISIGEAANRVLDDLRGKM
jgi:hypothetical protein